MLQFCATVKPIHQGFPFEARLSEPSLAGSSGQAVEELLAYIRGLGKSRWTANSRQSGCLKNGNTAKNVKMQNGYILDACAFFVYFKDEEGWEALHHQRSR